MGWLGYTSGFKAKNSACVYVVSPTPAVHALNAQNTHECGVYTPGVCMVSCRRGGGGGGFGGGHAGAVGAPAFAPPPVYEGGSTTIINNYYTNDDTIGNAGQVRGIMLCGTTWYYIVCQRIVMHCKFGRDDLCFSHVEKECRCVCIELMAEDSEQRAGRPAVNLPSRQTHSQQNMVTLPPP